jgi:ABC-type branched-subunit amino acid transport system substrate-binding protein
VRGIKPRIWRVGALAAAAAVVVTACSSSSHSTNSSTGAVGGATGAGSGKTIPPPARITGSISGPGVTASTITIGQITTTSGPVPGLFQGANDGLDAYVKWINANGGIDGRTVKVVHVDDGFNCNAYTQAMNQFATSTFAIVGTFTLNDTCGKSVLAAYPNLLDVQAVALDPTLYSIPNVFTPTPTPPGYQTTGFAYFKSRFPNDITKTATLIGQSAAANGQEEMLTAESLGYKYVYKRVIGDFETNFTSDILRMKNDGVKIVDMGATAVTNVANFLQQANQQNFHPVALIAPSAYDAKLFTLTGNASLANNIVFAPLPYALYLGTDRASVPAVNTFLDQLNQAHPGDTANLFAVTAWAAGALLNEAMAKASASGSITQTSVMNALKGTTSFNADGLIAPNNPGQKQGGHCVIIASVVNGQWQRIEPSTGFDCSGTYHNVPLSELK